MKPVPYTTLRGTLHLWTCPAPTRGVWQSACGRLCVPAAELQEPMGSDPKCRRCYVSPSGERLP